MCLCNGIDIFQMKSFIRKQRSSWILEDLFNWSKATRVNLTGPNRVSLAKKLEKHFVIYCFKVLKMM